MHVPYFFAEVRSHGVGYYAFSKDEEKRSEQLDMLHELSKQTEKQKSSREKLLQKRKAMMTERLAKVRERKKLKPEEPEPDPNIGTCLQSLTYCYSFFA